MKLKRTKRSLFEPTSVLSDLAFLLIIYFIVIAGFNINKGFLMNLPAKDSTRMLLKDDILRYELSETGNILYDGHILSREEAEKNISVAISAHPNLSLLLMVSPRAPWQNVVSFVEIAEKLSVDAFSFKISDTVLGNE